MPLWYRGVTSEHRGVRDAVGLFDVSHMGRSLVTGEKAAEFLDYVMSRDPSSLAVNQGQYAVMCTPRGGIIDDLTVFNLGRRYLVIYNASNRRKDFQWLTDHATRFEAHVRDISDASMLLALQGPKAQSLLQNLAGHDLSELRRYHVDWDELDGQKALISRSGYTGEDGFEIMLHDEHGSISEYGLRLWNRLLEVGERYALKPCGLAARDTLRLEAGMCLYGNDIDESVTPFEAQLGFVVKLDKDAFIGREALATQKATGVDKLRVGFRMIDHAIPRKACKVWDEDEEVGCVTSGGYSPLLRVGVAMGYVSTRHAREGNVVGIEIRGRRFNAEIVKMPFYDPDRYGWRRKKG
jgi:aminomethyltransferase